MKKFAMQLSYDGTGYNGWQTQPTGKTIQQTLEKALSEIAKQFIPIVGSGRTDSGVHALMQIAHFDFPVNMTTKQIKLGLQAKLPKDLKINAIYSVSDDFHARFNALERSYKYYIAKERTPFNRLYRSYFARKKIVPEKIKDCLPYFIGEHDFTSFAKPNPDLAHYICNIKKLTFEERKDDYLLQISANRFLHNMVRRIVGSLITVTNTELPPETIKQLIEAKKGDQKLIPTAPAQGLFLARVDYPEGSFFNSSEEQQ